MSVRPRYSVDRVPVHTAAVRRRPPPAMTGRSGAVAALQAQAGNQAVAALLSRSKPVQRCGGQQCEGCDKDTSEVQRLTVQRDAAAAEKVRNSVAQPDPDAKGEGYKQAFLVLNGLPMDDLLSTLTSLQRSAQFDLLGSNFRRATGVYVDRLTVAFEAVRWKGQTAVDAFLLKHKDVLGALPVDQRQNVIDYLNPAWFDALRTTEESADLLTAIRANPAYTGLAPDPRKLADEIIAEAAKVPPKQVYYLTKLKLLFDTKEKTAADISIGSRAQTAQAVTAETKRLAKPAEAKRAGIEEAASSGGKRKWIPITGQYGGGVYYVDRSSPTAIVVKARVFLQPGTTGTAKDVQNIKKMEDAIEKSASTKGYTVDIVFVDAASADKRGNPPFTINVHPGGWTNATHWGAGDPRALAHELHHCFAFRLDRYDYIEAHSANESMEIPIRLHWFRQEMTKPAGFNDPTSLMNAAEHPNDDDVCRVAGLDPAGCVALRTKKP